MHNEPREGFFDRTALHMNRFIQYLKDTRGELKHVSWPTQRQTIIYTTLVIIISLLMAGYLGLFDYLFTEILNRYFI